jgi:hypothetical protein
VPASCAAPVRIKREDYHCLHAESLRDPEGVWGREGKRVDTYRHLPERVFQCANALK